MPGYVIHLAEAKMIMDGLEERQVIPEDPDPDVENRFRLGALLPDVLRGSAKERTHFWNPADRGLLAKAPDLDRFRAEYGSRLETPEMLGYFVHLHLDERYVHVFWPRAFRFTDDAGRVRTRMDEITQVHLLQRGGICVPAGEFFSGSWYYGDYSRMNAYFFGKYHLTVPEYTDLPDFPVEEADPMLLGPVLSELRELKRTCRRGEEQELRVFDLGKLEAFLRETVRDAVQAVTSG